MTRNVLTKWAGNIVRAGVGIYLVPFLFGQFGTAGYGLMGIVATVTSLPLLLDAGLGSALSRTLAALLPLQKNELYRETVGTALTIYLLLGGLFAGLCFAFAESILRYCSVPPELRAQGLFLLRYYASVMILTSFASVVFDSVTISTGRFDLTNYVSLGVAIGHGALIVFVLSLTRTGLYGWGVVGMCESVALLLCRRQLAYHVVPTLTLKPRFSREVLQELLSLGVFVFLLNISSVLIARADPFILTTLIGLNAVGFYTAGGTIPGQLRSFVQALSGQLLPISTQFYSTDQHERLTSILIRGTRYTLLMGVGSCVTVAVFARPVVDVWLKRRLGADCAVVAQVMTLAAMVELSNYLAGSQWPVLLAMKKIRVEVVSQLVGAVINVIASALLVYYTREVVATLIPTLVIGLARRTYIMVKTAEFCGISLREYFLESYWRPLLVGIAMLGTTVALRWQTETWTWLTLGGCVGLSVLAWIGLSWFVGIGPADRSSFRALTNRVIARAAAS